MPKVSKRQGLLQPYIFTYVLLLLLVVLALSYKLGNLLNGYSVSEINLIRTPLGWHGLYHNSLYLPLKLIESFIFKIDPHHGQLLSRLPNAILATVAIACFSGATYVWHGRRIALLTTILFGFGAWGLHIGRYASYDVVYYVAISALVLVHALFYKYSENRWVIIANFTIWGLLLTIPGLWIIVLIDILFQARLAQEALKTVNKRTKVISIVLFIIWLPLIIHSIIYTHDLRYYLGLPNHLPSITRYIKNVLAVPYHLLVRGPSYPSIWLSRLPILDAFSLALSVLGALFYVKHYTSSRSRFLGALLVASTLLIGLGGPVGFSLIVPLAYFLAATGLAYLLHLWLSVFPENPIARNLGIGLIAVAVIFSAFYNVRAYFVAYRYNPQTKQIFSHHLLTLYNK